MNWQHRIDPWFRPELLRVAAGLSLSAGTVLLFLHFRSETVVGLTANGSVAFGDDSINFWGGAVLALKGRVEDVYNLVRFHMFQSDALKGPIHLYHYVYPPTMLLLSLPLGLLPYLAFVAIWLIGGCVVFLATVRCAWCSSRRGAWDIVLYSLSLPALLINIAAGQTGTFVAAALGFGLMIMERKPVLSGLLFACLLVKPQMGLLLPVALVAGGRWKVLTSAGAAAAVLVAASLIAFGWSTWREFFDQTALMWKWDVLDGRGVWHWSTSVFVAAQHTAAPLVLAYAAQVVSTLGAVLLVSACWRRRAPQLAKNSVLVMAIFFSTPYVQVYDLVVAMLVPLWLLQSVPECDPKRGIAYICFAPLIVAPLFAPAIAPPTGLNVGFLFLIPTLAFSAYVCAGFQPIGTESTAVFS